MISIVKQPIKYTPANNPVVFTLSGNSTDLVLFKLRLREAYTNSIVYTGNIYPTPVNPNKASVNLSNQLSALVRSDVDNADTIITGKTKNILGYNLVATEYGITSGGTLSALTADYNTGSFYAFEADFDIQNYTTYQLKDYVVTTASTGTTKFLTHQPDKKVVNSYSSEQLYFLQSGLTSLDIQVVAGSNSYNFPLSGENISFFGLIQRQDDQATFLFYFKGDVLSVGDVVTVTLYYDVAMTPVVFTSTVLAGWTTFDLIGDLYNQIDLDGRFIVSLTSVGIGLIITTVGGIALDGLVAIVTSSSTLAELDKMLRIQVSPKKLISAGVNLSNVGSYTVKVRTSTTGETLSETRTYIIQEPECGLDLVNVLFTNSLGGVDSIQLVNPQESVSASKASIKKSNINLDASDVYLANGNFNISEEVYEATSKYSFKAYTHPLTDSQAEWLNELVTSKQHFIELKSGELLPVFLKTTNYSIQKKKYLQQQLNTYQFEFELPDGFIPAITSNKLTIN